MAENSGIGGKVRIQQDFSKKVGLFVGRVISINPSREEYKEVLGIDLNEDSKATDYLGKSKEDNTTLRINVWFEESKTKQKYPVTFFLEDKKKENKTEEGDGKVKKFQYINNIGSCSWSDDPNNLPDWFKKRDYRVAFVGEEELYNFMRTWLGTLDYRDADTVLQIEWKKLMKGNVSDLKAQIGGEYATNVVPLAGVKTVVKEGEESKEYQSVFNKAFLPEYCLKFFRLVDYNKPEVQAQLKAKQSKDLKPHERFVLTVIGQYGFQDFYKFCDLKEYDPAENIVASNEPMTVDGSDY